MVKEESSRLRLMAVVAGIAIIHVPGCVGEEYASSDVELLGEFDTYGTSADEYHDDELRYERLPEASEGVPDELEDLVYSLLPVDVQSSGYVLHYEPLSMDDGLERYRIGYNRLETVEGGLSAGAPAKFLELGYERDSGNIFVCREGECLDEPLDLRAVHDPEQFGSGDSTLVSNTDVPAKSSTCTEHWWNSCPAGVCPDGRCCTNSGICSDGSHCYY